MTADIYTFVSTVSIGAKSHGGRCRCSMCTVTVDVAAVRRALMDAVGPTKSGTSWSLMVVQARWIMLMGEGTEYVDVGKQLRYVTLTYLG